MVSLKKKYVEPHSTLLYRAYLFPDSCFGEGWVGLKLLGMQWIMT
jgi:hypothetical protein